MLFVICIPFLLSTMFMYINTSSNTYGIIILVCCSALMSNEGSNEGSEEKKFETSPENEDIFKERLDVYIQYGSLL